MISNTGISLVLMRYRCRSRCSSDKLSSVNVLDIFDGGWPDHVSFDCAASGIFVANGRL